MDKYTFNHSKPLENFVRQKASLQDKFTDDYFFYYWHAICTIQYEIKLILTNHRVSFFVGEIKPKMAFK